MYWYNEHNRYHYSISNVLTWVKIFLQGTKIRVRLSEVELGDTTTKVTIKGDQLSREAAVDALTKTLLEWTEEQSALGFDPTKSNQTCIKMLIPIWAIAGGADPTARNVLQDIGSQTNTCITLESPMHSPSFAIDTRVIILTGTLADIFVAQEVFITRFKTFYGETIQIRNISLWFVISFILLVSTNCCMPWAGDQGRGDKRTTLSPRSPHAIMSPRSPPTMLIPRSPQATCIKDPPRRPRSESDILSKTVVQRHQQQHMETSFFSSPSLSPPMHAPPRSFSMPSMRVPTNNMFFFSSVPPMHPQINNREMIGVPVFLPQSSPLTNSNYGPQVHPPTMPPYYFTPQMQILRSSSSSSTISSHSDINNSNTVFLLPYPFHPQGEFSQQQSASTMQQGQHSYYYSEINPR